MRRYCISDLSPARDGRIDTDSCNVAETVCINLNSNFNGSTKNGGMSGVTKFFENIHFF